jgi:hypothetical protein
MTSLLPNFLCFPIVLVDLGHNFYCTGYANYPHISVIFLDLHIAFIWTHWDYVDKVGTTDAAESFRKYVYSWEEGKEPYYYELGFVYHNQTV